MSDPDPEAEEPNAQQPDRGADEAAQHGRHELAPHQPRPAIGELQPRGFLGMLRRGDNMLGQRSVAQFLHRPHEELYDLTRAPNELRNVAGAAGNAAVLADLRKRLRDWQKTTGDPWTIKYRHE